jgi:magnesium transporter
VKDPWERLVPSSTANADAKRRPGTVQLYVARRFTALFSDYHYFMPTLHLNTARWPTLQSGDGKFLDLPDLPGLPNLDRSTVAGISVAIAGNILISLALNCQKLAHRRLEIEREGLRDSNDQKTSAKPRPIGGNALGITVEEQDEFEDTEAIAEPLESETTAASAVADAETEPLLNRPQATHSYGSHASEPALVSTARKPPWFSRFSPWGTRSKLALSDMDGVDLQAAHSIIPVDVVTVRPKSPERQDSKRSQMSLDQTNESAYLKSKLWCAAHTAHASV